MLNVRRTGNGASSRVLRRASAAADEFYRLLRGRDI